MKLYFAPRPRATRPLRPMEDPGVPDEPARGDLANAAQPVRAG